MLAHSMANQDLDFDFDFYSLFWDLKRRAPIAMTVELFSNKNLISFALLDLCHKETGKLDYGFHTLDLYNPPISFFWQEMKKVKDETIGLSIMDLATAPPLVPPANFEQNSPERRLTNVNSIDISPDRPGEESKENNRPRPPASMTQYSE